MFHFLTDATGAAGMASPLLMLVIFFVIMYFMLIRPENKRKKEAEQMRSGVPRATRSSPSAASSAPW